MTELKTYSGHAGSHTGSSGFTNHFSGGPICRAKALARVFRDFPDAVVLNGSDDFTAPLPFSATKLCRAYGIPLLAYFHTGVSGIARSGVVISKASYERFLHCLKTFVLEHKTQEYVKERGHVRSTFPKVTRAVGGFRGEVYSREGESYRGLHGSVKGTLAVNGRSYRVHWSVSLEDGTVSWALDNGRGTRYRLVPHPSGHGLYAVNPRTGRPSTTALGKARFVEKNEYLAVAGTPAADQKQGWHGSVFYG